MTDKITREAAQRLRENPPPKVLRTMRELEILLLERKAKKLRDALDGDQSDISTAFAADTINPKGWDVPEAHCGNIEP